MFLFPFVSENVSVKPSVDGVNLLMKEVNLIQNVADLKKIVLLGKQNPQTETHVKVNAYINLILDVFTFITPHVHLNVTCNISTLLPLKGFW